MGAISDRLGTVVLVAVSLGFGECACHCGGAATTGSTSAGVGGASVGSAAAGAMMARSAFRSSVLDTQSPLFVNLGDDCYWCQRPTFVDLMKSRERWRLDGGESGDQESTIPVDSNGWVTTLDWGGARHRIDAGTGPIVRSGTYYLRWKGRGTFSVTGIDGPTYRETIVSEGDGERKLTLQGAQVGTPRLGLGITAVDPSDHLRDFVLVHADFLQTFERSPFYPEMLGYLRRFSGVRFMDWLQTNNSRLSTWDSRNSQTARPTNSIEHAIDICNAIRRHCWLTVPHRANDDYVERMAYVVRARLDPKLLVFVEYSNEVWNSGFKQHAYAIERGIATTAPGRDEYEKGAYYYGVRSVEIFKIFERVFGSETPSRVRRVVAGQAANSGLIPLFLGQADHAQHVDFYASAPYIHASSAANPGWTLDDVFADLQAEGLPAAIDWMRSTRDSLAPYGIPHIAYEGGQHLVSDHDRLRRLFQEANRDPRMGALYTEYLDAWRASGGRYFALYDAMGPWTSWGSWGLITHLGDSTPKLTASLGWAERNPLWWKT